MSIIIVDDLAVRLVSELRNVFNPSYAFGGMKQGGSLALRDAESGHLLLPYDAEGNVIVTPGRRYGLVFVTQKNTENRDSDTTKQTNVPQKPTQRPRAEELHLPGNTAVHTKSDSKLQEKVMNKGSELESLLTPETVVTSGDTKKRRRSSKNQAKPTEENDTVVSRNRTEDRGTPNGKENGKDSVIVSATGNGASITTAVADASTVAARKSSSPVVVDGTPKTRISTRPPSNTTSDSDDVPFSKVYTRQVPRTASAASVRGPRGQTRRVPELNPTTSESD